MLNFRSQPKPRKPIGTAYRRRLIYLVGALVLVIYMMGRLQSPQTVEFLTRVFREPAAQKQSPTTSPAADQSQVKEGALDAARPPLEAPDLRRPFYERVRHDLLRDVEENVRFLPQERPVFFHLLRLLKEADAAAIAAAPSQRVTRYELWSQSPSYRGQIVTVSGVVRGVRKMPLRDNPDGIREYFEVWLEPDGHSKDPIAIYSLELPEGFPVSMVAKEMHERVDVKGFYYRRWWYSAQKDKLIAPLMLAKTLSWTPAPPPPAAADFNLPLALGVTAALAVLAVALVAWRFHASSSTNTLPDYVRRYAKETEQDSQSIGDALQRLDNSPEQGGEKS